MPGETIIEITQAEQEQILRQLRRARYGHLLGLHFLMQCAALAELRTDQELRAA